MCASVYGDKRQAKTMMLTDTDWTDIGKCVIVDRLEMRLPFFSLKLHMIVFTRFMKCDNTPLLSIQK